MNPVMEYGKFTTLWPNGLYRFSMFDSIVWMIKTDSGIVKKKPLESTEWFKSNHFAPYSVGWERVRNL